MAYVVIKRPKIIAWICIIGFILVVFSMPSVFSPDTRRMGDFYPALFSLLIAFRFIGYVGLWHMKRWGVEMFMITFAASSIQSFLLSEINPVGVIYHLAVLVVLIVKYRTMDRNL